MHLLVQAMIDFNIDLKKFVEIHQIDIELCKRITNQLANNPNEFQQHEFFNAKDNHQEAVLENEELDVSFTAVDAQTHTELMGCLYQVISNYIIGNSKDRPWFDNWSGYSSLRYNRYEQGKQMDLHCDHIHSIFSGDRKGIPVLTMLAHFNDECDYEGGDLLIWDQHIRLKQGQVIIFPSCFLYPHKVEPVKSGVRFSGVSWVW